MRLQRLARTLAAAALASCGSNPAATPAPATVWTKPDRTDLALVPIEPAPKPPPPVVDPAPPPDPVPTAPASLVNTRRFGAIARAEVVLAVARRPAGTVMTLFRGQSIFGPPEWKLCPDFEASCKPWPEYDQIGFVDARRRIKRRDWKDLAKDAARRAKQHGTGDLALAAYEQIRAGSYATMFWFEDGTAWRRTRTETMPAVLRLRPQLPRPGYSKIDYDRLPGDVIRTSSLDHANPATPAEHALVALYDRHRGSFPLSPDLAVVRELASGSLITFLSQRDCGEKIVDEVAFVLGDGPPTMVYAAEPWTKPCRNPGGRRPPGLVTRELDALAELAHLEAASVASFTRIADELAGFGAPAALIERARAAARDEARHARMVGTLAGCEPEVELAATATRDAFAFALDNAVEGCVHESFAAIVCAYQAIAAEDPAVAAVMSEIAGDEARHGELAWDIARWLEPRLPAAQQHAIAEARRTALTSLDAIPTPSSARLGLPDHATRRFLATGYRAHVSARAS